MPGTLTPVLPQPELNRLLAGIDVALLLRDIGEASASTNPVELFRLCLDAQRVLARVQDGHSDSTAPGEVALLAAFRASAEDARADIILMAQAIAGVSPRSRPALTLLKSRQTHSVEAI
jgi:hypothetical protein